MRIGLVNRAAVEIRQLRAVGEHVDTISHAHSIPLVTHIDSSKRFAGAKHVAHILHIGRVEATDIQAGERVAVGEHVLHSRHLGRVEAANIQAGK